MADPLSILAIAGLVYTGKKLSKKTENSENYVITELPTEQPVHTVTPDFVPSVVSPFTQPQIQNKLETPSFSDIAPQPRTSGQELMGMRNRFDAGRMNNISPVEKQLVGPGLGVGPDVDSVGGYQQLFRVNPENVGAYRLTTLPGRSGPAFDKSGGRRGISGEIGNNRPEKTAFLPERLPPQQGRAQGMSAMSGRSSHEKTIRETNRSETGSRTDGLSIAAPKRIISANTLYQAPTRNKKDGNIEQFEYSNHPAPNINKYAHGYLNSPAVKAQQGNFEEQQSYGIRIDDRRGKAGRMNGGGRMNVRAGPLNQGGIPTTLRSDTTRIDGRVNSADGAWTQQYRQNDYYELNSFKGKQNPNASQNSLNTAKRQLYSNPLAHSLS
tara:strand:- start:9836 stop:10981 length:1146 start_codon:yes stop_codon:yes gene_type:complete